MKYNINKIVDLEFDDAIIKVKEKLKDEGFGILTQIDVKETLKNKIGVDFDKYIILGACNPPFAHKALLAELEVGLLLPCNVIVYENKEHKVSVSAINPRVAMSGIVDNEELNEIAEQIALKLEKVINEL